METIRRDIWLLVAVCLAFGTTLGVSTEAHAVRPFVTDDARIIDVGQFELEMWPELVVVGGQVHPGFHGMGGVTFTEWFELIFGGGFGLQPDGQWTVTNPIIQPKFLVWRAEDNGVPGLAIGVGVTLPFGTGEMFDDATGLYAMAMLTSRLYDDWLLVHFNAGVRAAIVPENETEGTPIEAVVRPYFGFGLDIGLFHQDVRLILEAYTGDPFEALGPDYAFQYGLRWLANDYLNFDVTLGNQPVVENREMVEGQWEFWIQFGIRILADVFTDGRGDPMGARGMTRAFRAPAVQSSTTNGNGSNGGNGR